MRLRNKKSLLLVCLLLAGFIVALVPVPSVQATSYTEVFSGLNADGYIANESSDWGASTGTVYDSALSVTVGSGAGITRGFVFFNVALPDGAVVTDAILSLYVGANINVPNGYQSFVYCVGSAEHPSNPLQENDFAQSNYPGDYFYWGDSSAIQTNAYFNVSVAVDSLGVGVGGLTTFCLRAKADVDGGPVDYYAMVGSAETGNKPKLYVSYTLPEISFSSISVSSVVANSSCVFSASVESAAYTLSHFIFSCNNTGVWVNDTAVEFVSTPGWANVSKTLNNAVDRIVGYRWFANDSLGNWGSSSVQSLTTRGYVVTPSADENCIISPDEPVLVCAGASLEFTFSALGGYSVESVIINGSYSASVESPFWFYDIQGNQSIQVSSSSEVYYINATWDAHSVMTFFDAPIVGLVAVPFGSWANFSCSAYPGYRVYNLAVNGSNVGPVDGYRFMPSGNTSLYLSSASAVLPGGGGGGYVLTVTASPAPLPTEDAVAVGKASANNFFFVVGVVLLLLLLAVVVYSRGAKKTISRQVGDWNSS
jgi:hypothetical protein